MTVSELREKLEDMYGFEKWPSIHYVDHETYANVCQWIFNHKSRDLNERFSTQVSVSLGLNAGIMFKGVELMLEDK